MNPIKNSSIAIIITFLVLSACNTSHKVKINGNISEAIPGKIYLTEYNLTHEKVIDSTEISQKGKFAFRLKVFQPQLFKLYVNRDNYIWLLLSPGEMVQLSILAKKDTFSYTVSGSAYSEQVKMLNDTLEATQKKLGQLKNQYILALLKNDKNAEEIAKQYQQTIEKQRKFSIGFIINNLHSPASIVALYQQFNDSLYVFHKTTDLQYVKLLADTLSKYYPQSNIVKVLCNERNKLMEQYQQVRKQYSILSSTKAEIKAFPELKLPSISGDTVSLSSTVKKITLLTFWTPLDPDCRVAMNTFATLHAKYQNKGFELYNVAIFDDAGYWKNMVKKLNLPGIHVIELGGINSASLKIYNVQQLPANVLISKNGVIAINLFGDRLENEIRKNLIQ
ncbi:MAG: AhpC/TSA family protein [Bacteroidales bacterium]|nr:AhpC/TSA family protein [Bacteroidales bacterium]